MSKHYRKENNCLNCGKDVDGKFCSNCGQENIEIREPFWAFVSHGIGHYFHYDSKFKKTLRPFLTKPGQLTKDYIEGRRASHIPPISLYLFITLVYFLCAPIFKEREESISRSSDQRNGKTGELNTGRPDKESYEDSIYTVFENYSYDRQLRELAKLDSLSNTNRNDSSSISSNFLKRLQRLNLATADSSLSAYRKRQAALPESDRDEGLNRFLKERKIGYKEKTGHEFDLGDIMDKYFPKLLFILMPLFAFFLMLNFRKNRKLYMEHLIYTIHLFSFAFLSFLVSEILQFITPPHVEDIIEMIFFGILVWYTYRSIRVVYERSRWVSVRKLFSVSILFLVAFVITYLAGMIMVIAFT